MASDSHISSYYATTAHGLVAHPQLLEEVDCDVCVIGGGIAGCSAALHLAERGYRVVLLEKNRIGSGASGRSGGQVLPGYACGETKLVKLVGKEVARQLWDVSVEGVRLVKDLITRHRIDCDWASGHLQAAIKRAHQEELIREQRSLEDNYAYPGLRLMEAAELSQILATDRYSAGLYDPNAGHLHPLSYSLGLAAAAARQGVKIYERTRAVRFDSGSLIRVSSSNPGASARCRHLVLCGNTALGETAPALTRKIMSVGSYMIATVPLGEPRARQLIANNMAVNDMNWILDHFRRSADHRLLFGGRVSYSGLLTQANAAATRARLLKVFPQLADAPVEFAWGGHLDITLNRAPHFGRLAPNVYFLQGFSGHGIALAGIAGKLLAEAMAGTAERFDLFSRIPHTDFPGGQLLRRPSLILGMLYYRLRDLL